MMRVARSGDRWIRLATGQSPGGTAEIPALFSYRVTTATPTTSKISQKTFEASARILDLLDFMSFYIGRFERSRGVIKDIANVPVLCPLPTDPGGAEFPAFANATRVP
jgi:hypothetical protein